MHIIWELALPNWCNSLQINRVMSFCAWRSEIVAFWFFASIWPRIRSPTMKSHPPQNALKPLWGKRFLHFCAKVYWKILLPNIQASQELTAVISYQDWRYASIILTSFLEALAKKLFSWTQFYEPRCTCDMHVWLEPVLTGVGWSHWSCWLCLGIPNPTRILPWHLTSVTKEIQFLGTSQTPLVFIMVEEYNCQTLWFVVWRS